MLSDPLKISANSLKPGDILLTKDKTHDFFRHVSVITQVDANQQDYQIAHWRGMKFPYALTEMSLPSKEFFQGLNLEYHVFRLKDQAQALRVTDILRKWCLWSIPYDMQRTKTAEEANNNFFNISSDILNGKWPEIDRNLLEPKLLENYNLLNKVFKDNYMDVVKYAARRDISPVRPKLDAEKQTGFHCLQGVLIAFQVSYAQDFVDSLTDEWVSNKKITQFNSARKALRKNFDLENFLSTFPPAFQLSAKLCSVETFKFALENDETHIQALGVLELLQENKIVISTEEENKKMLCMYEISISNKKHLLDEVILPTLKSKRLSIV